MEILSVKTIKELLEKYQAKPSKALGQNFLIDANTLQKTLQAADVNSKDTVVEIGPGLGTLTKELSLHAKKVIAIEKDRTMVEILKETLKDCDNVKVIQEDALKYQPPKENYKVVANIPYYITSPVIRKFLEEKHQPEEIILMVQKEVAQRICAKPGDMSILAVSVQFYATASIVSYVSKGCFWPVPNVDSAILKIVPFKKPSDIPADKFFKVVKAGFLHPRKQLAGNLSGALKKEKSHIESWLLKNNIKPNQRAETLSIKDWEGLSLHLPDLD